MLLLPFTLLFSSWSILVNAGSVNKGGNCSVSDNRLEVGTYQFYSDCDPETYCSSAGICELKGCRRDQYPFGYAQNATLPPKCPAGQFCPDEGDACQPWLPVGSPCQLNRDDQCEPPPNFQELSDNSNYGRNFNGSVCLNNVCMWANVTVGLNCTVENTAYIAYAGSSEFLDIVSRGNCHVGLYCDSQQLVCMQSMEVGETCEADKQCASFNCLSTGVCGESADSPKHFGVWLYAVVCVAIFGGMIATLIILFFLHRRQRDAEREKRLQYWREQNAFRQNIMQMRETARASILSLPGNGNSNRNSTYSHANSEESTMPMLQHSTNRASGLRQYFSADGDYDEGLLMQDGSERHHRL